MGQNFFSLKVNYNKAIRSGFSKDSAFYKNLKVYKSYPHGDLDVKYESYMNLLYRNFVDKYLSVNRRADKIRDFKSFVKEFLRY